MDIQPEKEVTITVKMAEKNSKNQTQSPEPTKKPRKIDTLPPGEPQNRERGLTIVSTRQRPWRASGLKGHLRRVVVAVRPLPEKPGIDRLAEKQAQVVFIEDDVEDPDEFAEEQSRPRTPGEWDEVVSQLQAEIQRLRKQLQITNHLGGLMNIRHRLILMGCIMEIQSDPGKGTQVMINVPKQQVT